MDTKTLCERLLHAVSEDEAIAILKEAGYWDKREAWTAYGDISNNRGVVGNQQSSAIAALVEKLVNSIDAVLISECHRHGIDPRSANAPQSMQAATAKFFGITDGKLELADTPERGALADKIRLVAMGNKAEPCYLIIDKGEGQTPVKFPDTFLSLLRENKAGVPFVQGRFNMGGTGVLQFSGKRGLQLIVSRKQVHMRQLPDDALWGFTIIRRIGPFEDRPFTYYAYLAPQGRILSFDAEAMPLLPGRYPEPFAEALEAGTCIKVWNYKLPGRLKTIATLDIRYALESQLQSPALPIRLQERRQGYRANYYDTTMAGLFSVLKDSPDKIEPGLDTGAPLDVPNVGRVGLRVVVLKEDIGDEKRFPSGLFFNVNGQLHGEIGHDVVARKTHLDYLADSLVVMADCTELPQEVREDLFLASRDRMRQIDERKYLEEAIVDYLREHPGLKELNARRRQQRVSAKSEEESINVFQELLKADPTLASLFIGGKQVKVPRGPEKDTIPYEGRAYPTFFRLLNEPSTGLTKKCPKNRKCRVAFETDVTNDYFSRSNDPGHLASRGMAQQGAPSLWNGRCTVPYSIPEAANVGDRIRVVVQVNDSSRPAPFESSFVIEVLEEAQPGDPGPDPQPPKGNMAGVPNVEEVYQADWKREGFTELSAVKVKHNDKGGVDLFVNMDNLFLKNEIHRRRKLEPEMVKHWFKWGMALLVVGMLYDQRNAANAAKKEGEEERKPEDNSSDEFKIIERACQGLAVTIVPVMVQVGLGTLSVGKPA